MPVHMSEHMRRLLTELQSIGAPLPDYAPQPAQYQSPQGAQGGSMPSPGSAMNIAKFFNGGLGGASGAGDAAYAASPEGSGAYIGGSDGLGALSVGSGEAGAGEGIGGGLSGAAGGEGAAGGLAAAGPYAALAALIGIGKNTEANHAGTPLGDGLLAGLAPSGAQIAKDPLGMGLPALLGVPFITPFTASKEAKATRPEWSSLFRFGF